MAMITAAGVRATWWDHRELAIDTLMHHPLVLHALVHHAIAIVQRYPRVQCRPFRHARDRRVGVDSVLVDCRKREAERFIPGLATSHNDSR